MRPHTGCPGSSRFKIDALLYSHVGLASGGERPVLTSVRNALTPQLASINGHCPE